MERAGARRAPAPSRTGGAARWCRLASVWAVLVAAPTARMAVAALAVKRGLAGSGWRQLGGFRAGGLGRGASVHEQLGMP